MIQAATRLVVQRGIGGTRLTEVGLEAGYSRGLAAMRFGTKAGLLSRVARHALSSWIRRVTDAVGTKTGLAAVLAAIDAQDRWVQEAPDEMRVIYMIFFQSMDPSAEYHLNVAHSLVAQRRDLSRWIREARDADEVDRSVDPEAEAAQVLSGMVGIVYQSIMDPDVRASPMHAKLKADLRTRLARSRLPVAGVRTQRSRARKI